MNIYLTGELVQTQSLINAKFLYIEDKPSFIGDCDRQNIISRGVKEEGIVYYWNGEKWSEINAEDASSFQELVKGGYKNTPNLYLSANFKILAKSYEDNIESIKIQYKILNQGKNTGLFKKNNMDKWKRRISPEEAFILCQINEKAKGEIYRGILKDIIKNKY